MEGNSYIKYNIYIYNKILCTLCIVNEKTEAKDKRIGGRKRERDSRFIDCVSDNRHCVSLQNIGEKAR